MDVIGKYFRTGKTTFRVVEGESFPANRVSKRYKSILSFRPGLLVACGFRGVCIPNITRPRGVVRLTKIDIDGQVYDRPSTISQALGMKDPMVPYPLREL